VNTKKGLVVLTTLLLLFSTITVVAYADSSGESEGTVTVSSALPAIDNIQLTDVASVDKNDSALTVSTEYWLIWNVTDANTMEELDNCTIWIYDDTSYDPGDADAERGHYEYTYIESTDTWSCPLSANYIIQANCSAPADGLTDGEFTLAFDLSKVANYSNGASPYDWKANITVYDDANNQDTESQIQHGVVSYFEVSVTDTTHSFGSCAPGSTDSEVQSEPIDFTVIANTKWKGQAQANDTILTDGDGHDFQVGNITIYDSDVVGSSFALSDSWQDFTGNLNNQDPPTAEASPLNRGIYAWIDIPAAQFAADYQYKLEIQIIIHS